MTGLSNIPSGPHFAILSAALLGGYWGRHLDRNEIRRLRASGVVTESLRSCIVVRSNEDQSIGILYRHRGALGYEDTQLRLSGSSTVNLNAQTPI